jgi:hypothetical protein
MQLVLRVEQVREEHIEAYCQLSRAEYGDAVAVAKASHLRWKFIENPQGPSIGIHLYKGDELVGRMVALTRQFLYQDKVYKAAHIVDFVVHPKERGMSSLLMLVSGLKQLSGYDFLLIMAPNAAGAAVWEKFVKMRGYFQLDVAVAPLRPFALLEATGKLRVGDLAPILDWPWRVLVGATTRLLSYLGDVQIEFEWPSSAEIDKMLSSNKDDRVIGVRSAAYLEWRYRRSPVFQYRVLFLRRKGALEGYFVTRRALHDGIDGLFVVDAFGRPGLTDGSWRATAREEISRASTDGAAMTMLMGNSAWGPLRAMNALPFLTVPPRFLPRKMTVYAEWKTSPGFEIGRNNFHLALGDSDVI